jgi:hypothetical protein
MWLAAGWMFGIQFSAKAELFFLSIMFREDIKNCPSHYTVYVED